MDMLETPYLKEVTQFFQNSKGIFKKGNLGDELRLVDSGARKFVKNPPQGMSLRLSI